MELANQKLVLQEQVDLLQQPSYFIEKPAEHYRAYHATADTASNQTIAFSVVPPSPDIVLDRRVSIRVGVEFQLQGNDDGSPLVSFDARTRIIASNDITMRKAPLQSVCSTIELLLNDASFTQTISDYIAQLDLYNQDYDWKQRQASTFPNQNDMTQSYEDLAFGRVRDPFTAPFENGKDMSRRVFLRVHPTVAVTNTTATLRAEWVEDLYLSPLLFGSAQDAKGLYGLDKFNIQFNLGSSLERLFCINNRAGRAISIVANSINIGTGAAGGLGAPELHLHYYTPIKELGIPSRSLYPYYSITRFPQDVNQTIAAWNSAVNYEPPQNSISVRNIQFASVPKRVYIFIRQSNSVKSTAYNSVTAPRSGAGMSDACARIDGVNIQFANVAGLLANLDTYDLYRMSAKNGLQMSYHEWAYFYGSVLCIDFGSGDIGLPIEVAPGSRGTWQFQADITFSNIADYALVNPTAYVVPVFEGIVDITDRMVRKTIGTLYPSDVLSAESLLKLERIPRQHLANYQGGGWWDKLKKWGSDAFNWTKKNLPQIIQTGRKVAPLIAPLVGLGATDMQGMGAYPGYGMGMATAGKGGALTGGKKFSRASLRKRAM